MTTFAEHRQFRDPGGRFAGTAYAAADDDVAFDEPTSPAEPGTADGQPDDDSDAREEIRYSFLAEFEKTEERFDTDFAGIPNRFFNADLRGKVLDNVEDDDLDALHDLVGEYEPSLDRYFDDRRLAGRLCHSVSVPAENMIDDEQATALISDLDGVTNVQRIEDEALLNAMSRNATRGWLAKFVTVNELGDREERWLAVTDASDAKLAPYTLRRSHGDIRRGQQFTQTDLRSLAGARRIEDRTGENLVALKASTPATRGKLGINRGDYPDMEQDRASPWSSDDYRARLREAQRREAASMQASVGALSAMEDAQLEGRNFLAQKKYVREQNRTIATAFDDKKHPDKTRTAMMESTSLAAANGGTFTKVEIDNDVDPAEYANFEAAVHEVESKLPPIPAGRRPDLRIRKLGKHKANGAYNPARNTVAIDVRTSEAYVHEMGHYYDFAVKDNASLSAGFTDISRAYQSALDEPDAKRAVYLNTPTEQLARGFEIYAHERLGIDNRLVNPSKFDRSDYAPYTRNPALKAKLFEFFDATFPDR